MDEIYENGHRSGVFYGQAFYDLTTEEMVTFQESIMAYKKYLAGELKGDKGEKGDQGLQGIQGVPGSDGSEGPAGIQGTQGPQGIQGPAGPIGPAGLTWKGQWSAEVTYNKDEAVGYDGASYFSLKTSTGSIPTLLSEDWALLASQGAQGPQGVQGEKGDKGAQGDKGSIGATGPQGVQGPRGIQGVQGVQGIQGAKGDDRATVLLGQSPYTQSQIAIHNLPNSKLALRITGTSPGASAGNLWLGVTNNSGASKRLSYTAISFDANSSQSTTRYSGKASASVANGSSEWFTIDWKVAGFLNPVEVYLTDLDTNQSFFIRLLGLSKATSSTDFGKYLLEYTELSGAKTPTKYF